MTARKEKIRKKPRKQKKAWDTIKGIIIIVLLVVIIRVYFVEAFQIPSGSMKDTLLVGDLLLTNKLIYRFTEPKRGDIIIFKYPHQDNTINPYKTLKQWIGDLTGRPLINRKNLIKRVIGLPGEKLEIKDGVVYINGKPLKEPYLKFKPEGNFGPYKIPSDNYFLMGDNRNESSDSRYWGTLNRKFIIGKALFIYWSWVPSNCNIFTCRGRLLPIDRDKGRLLFKDKANDVEKFYICEKCGGIHREWWDGTDKPFYNLSSHLRFNRLLMMIH
ncbi:MAG: signal peptidase I [bacterium]